MAIFRRHGDHLRALRQHYTNILLDSSKDDDHSDHSEGESINDTDSSEIGKNVTLQFVFRYGDIGRSARYFF